MIAENPWISGAAWLTLRLLAVGGAWGWLLALEPDAVGLRRRVLDAAAALWTGVVVNGVAATLLAEYGWYSPWSEAVVLVAAAIAGVTAGVVRSRARALPHWRSLAWSAPFAFLAFAAVMGLPERGEWIAGGWDPGIYVNQGVQAARTGTFHPDPSPLLRALQPDELALFTEQHHGFTAYFPVVPIDPETRAVQPFFFRFTPSLIAVLERCGGLRAATRVNLVLGVIGAVVFTGLLLAYRRPWPAAASALLLLLTHPIWVFLMHFPTSEMTQFVLLAGVLMLFPSRSRPPVAMTVLPVGLLAAMLNRFSFVPFAGILLCLLTWLDQDRPDRRQVLAERFLQAAGVAAGLGHNLVWCGVAVGRLDELAPPLVLVGAGLTAVSLGLETMRLRTGGRRILAWIDRRVLLAGVAAAFAGGAVLGLLPIASGHLDLPGNVAGALPWLGPPLVLIAVTGYAWLLLDAERLDREFVAVLTFLGLCAAVTFTVAAIAALYPWAARRHLVYTVPLLGLCAGEGISRLFARPGPRLAWRALAAASLLAAVAGGAIRSVHAWRRTEFNGLTEALAAVAERAGGTGRLVVVDHFRWGTPLHLIYDLHVLNGEYLWDAPNPGERTARALRALERLQGEGWSVQWLTSTPRRLSVYRHPIPEAAERWTSGPVDLADLKHGVHQTDFVLLHRNKEFTLYDGRPAPEPSGLTAPLPPDAASGGPGSPPRCPARATGGTPRPKRRIGRSES